VTPQFSAAIGSSYELADYPLRCSVPTITYTCSSCIYPDLYGQYLNPGILINRSEGFTLRSVNYRMEMIILTRVLRIARGLMACSTPALLAQRPQDLPSANQTLPAG